MSKPQTVDDVDAALSSISGEAATGEQVVIATGRKLRQSGLYAGRILFSEDLNAPWPEDIRRALWGENSLEPDNSQPSDV